MFRVYRQRGFTLLEILLVVSLIGIFLSLALPAFYVNRSDALDDEARRLQLSLRLAAEEVELHGQPMRWVGEAGQYHFELFTVERKWLPVAKAPFMPHRLSHGVLLQEVRQGSVMVDYALSSIDEDKKGAEHTLGQVLFLPGAAVNISDVVLAVKGQRSMQRTVELRPGPGGIRLLHHEARP